MYSWAGLLHFNVAIRNTLLMLIYIYMSLSKLVSSSSAGLDGGTTGGGRGGSPFIDKKACCTTPYAVFSTSN